VSKLLPEFAAVIVVVLAEKRRWLDSEAGSMSEFGLGVAEVKEWLFVNWMVFAEL
jgi:hypothetical protein